jgi:hypothetical protein
MKMLASRLASVGALPLAAFALLVGCGGDPVPATPPPQPTEAPAAAPAPAPSESPSAAAAAGALSAAASAAAAPPKQQGSGRPAVLKSDPTEVTDTFGSSPGAKIELGDKEIATLRIQEQTLGQATNITFKLDPKGKAGGAQVGKIYRIIPVLPPDSKPTKVASNNGTPFELALPAGNKKDANLAIGTIELDDKGREKIKWQVIAPKRIDDVGGIAHFELLELNDSFLHVTTKPATDAKK